MQVLNYGTVSRTRRRRLVGALMLAVFVPPASWCVSLRCQSLIAQRHEQAAITSRRAEIRYQVTVNLEQAKNESKQEHWSHVQIALDRARLAASADPTIFRTEEVGKFCAGIDRAQLDLQKALEEVSQRNHPRTLLQEQAQVVVFRRSNVVRDLMNATDRLRSQKRYGEAVLTLDQILVLDPQNASALKLRPILARCLHPTTAPALPEGAVAGGR